MPATHRAGAVEEVDLLVTWGAAVAAPGGYYLAPPLWVSPSHNHCHTTFWRPNP